MERVCPECSADLTYEVNGVTYSKASSVEIWGVYDGGLFYLHKECGATWHRWPEGHRLREAAQKYMDMRNAARESKT